MLARHADTEKECLWQIAVAYVEKAYPVILSPDLRIVLAAQYYFEIRGRK